MSRCIKAIPGEDESKSSFLVGVNTNTTACLYNVTYENETQQLASQELLNFNSDSEKIINDVIGLYTENPEYSSQINPNFFSQVFNQSENKYQLKYIKLSEEKYKIEDVPACDSDSTFE